MKAITTRGIGPFLKLTVTERKRPTPGPRDVLVKVHAASVNPKDWKLNRSFALVTGPIGQRLLPPFFGDDLAGEVVSVGRDVKTFATGDRVYGMDMRPRTASLAEYAVIDQRRIARIPPSVSYAEAAAMPLAAQTALQALRKTNAQAGSEVLIIGASGGVGTYAIQIAKAMGCKTTAVCSGRNAELVRELGADQTIDYTQGDFRQSAGLYDVVFDVTSYETPRTCAALLKDNGHFISTGGNARAVLSAFLTGGRRASQVVVESYTADLETLNRWWDEGRLRSIIDSRFSLEQAQQAYERSHSGRARGKIIIEIIPDESTTAASRS